MATDLLEREQEATQDDDDLNPGRRAYNEQFNPQEDEDDTDFDDIIDANYGDQVGDNKVDAHGDRVRRNYNADEPEKESAKASLRETEESGGRNSFYKPGGKSNLSGRLKGFGKKTPSLGIGGLIIGGGAITGAVIAGPMALIGAIERVASDDGNHSAGYNIKMHAAYMGNVVNNKNKDACKTSVCKRVSEVSDDHLKDLKDKGFKVDSTKVGDRNEIKKVTFDDGKEAASGEEFDKHTKENLRAADQASRYFDNRTSVFNDSPKLYQILERFGINKGKTLTGSDDKDPEKRRAAVDKSFDDNTGATARGDAATETRAISEEAKTKVGRTVGKAGNIATASIGAACTAYNSVRTATAVAKAKFIFDLIAFSYPFIQAASQIYDEGNIDPSVVEILGARLIWYSITPGHISYNQNAMDSQGLKAVFHGDYSKALDESSKRYSTARVAAIGDTGVKQIESTIGKNNLQSICSINRAAQMAQAIGCVAGPWAAAICGVGLGASAVLGPVIADKTIELLASPLADALAKANLKSDLRGKPAGDALGAGIAYLTMQHNMSSSSKPSHRGDKGKQEIKKYVAATNDDYIHQKNLALYQAQQTPFDATNPDTFAGRLAMAVNPLITTDKTAYTRVANLAATIFSAPTALLSGTANAIENQRSIMSAREDSIVGRTNMCDDQDMISNGFNCDMFGQMVGYSSPEALEIANDKTGAKWAEVTNELKDRGFIDDDGKPADIDDSDKIKDEQKTIFGKWIKNCNTPERIDPLGTTSEPSDDEAEQKWRLGTKCMADDGSSGSQASQDEKNHNRDLALFAYYWNMCTIQYPASEKLPSPKCWGSQKSTVNSTCGDGTTESIYTCALQYDDYRYLWGGGHGDIAKFVSDFKAGKYPQWTQVLDCSGLVRAATYEAMGGVVVSGGATPSVYASDSTHWQPISKEDAKQGDIVALGSNDAEGHVVIVQANHTPGLQKPGEPASPGSWDIFHASTDSGPQDKNITHSTLSYAGDGRPIAGVYRFKK